ncbi:MULTISPECIES: DUF2272 domain-containing protein [unclassified Mesorhizobium]|uniref:DUF2272 domain-containing protein n=1 Tax=unclassified Mesorhizobium TaxID=325217 RepID=UPI00112CC4A7|nr:MULTISPECIES: DUF2272 domain-containing protein [unclassified Mesorhizobium]TPM03530.1 DUF2272 domain-containing protein [Mesorhizobium sp. B2-3-8]TPM12782.1 DUF2272 domain-containing protein [Mesorhizobium sp. B2-3-7]
MLDPDGAWDAVASAISEIETKMSAGASGADLEALKSAKKDLLAALDDLAIDAYRNAAAKVAAARAGLEAIVSTAEPRLGTFLATAVALLPAPLSSTTAGGNSPVRQSFGAGVIGGADTGGAAGTALPGIEPTPGAFVERVVATCNTEWEFFGRQEYDIGGSIVRIGNKEGQQPYSNRIGTYWLEGTSTHGIDGQTFEMPWSAAFVSWVMKTAGAGDRFRYSTQHSVYISQAIRDCLSRRDAAGFWAQRLNEYRPKIGDIVCWSREAGVDYDNQKGGNYKGHSDVIVSIGDGIAWIIGGNVGNSVTKRPLALSDNGLLRAVAAGGEQLFAVMEERIAVASEAQTPSTLGSVDASNAATGGNGLLKIAWGKKVSGGFKSRVISIASTLGCDPSHLMAAIAFETGETFSPSIQNPISGATGLIQFMPRTAKDLGTSTAELASMTDVDQLDLVAKYFNPYVGKLNSLPDVYAAILFPIAVGRPDSTVLFQRPAIAYIQNAGLDVNGDGVITKSEATSKVQKKLDRGLSLEFIG